SSGAAEFLGNRIRSNVINAGDGKHEHPTQGLLDLLTIRDTHGKIEGIKVCLVGDVLHSRVARSNIWGLLKLGAEVGVCGPDTLLPAGIEERGVCRCRRIEEAIEWADVLNVLRLQLERMEMGFIPSVREYYRVFGVTAERLEKAGRPMTIMHPGPMNRGVEIDSRVADGPHSVILDQVTNGVAVRMAVLYLLAGGRPELADRYSTAIRTATPYVTWSRITLCGPSATRESISTPRFMGPGCMMVRGRGAFSRRSSVTPNTR